MTGKRWLLGTAVLLFVTGGTAGSSRKPSDVSTTNPRPLRKRAARACILLDSLFGDYDLSCRASSQRVTSGFP